MLKLLLLGLVRKLGWLLLLLLELLVMLVLVLMLVLVMLRRLLINIHFVRLALHDLSKIEKNHSAKKLFKS